MPRKSEIAYRNLVGLIPWARLTKNQKTYIEENKIPPDKIEYYFGKACKYWKVRNLKVVAL